MTTAAQAKEPLDLSAIRRRLPDVPREQMSRHEEDRADLLTEVDRLAAENATLREQIQRVRELAADWSDAACEARSDRPNYRRANRQLRAALNGDQPKPGEQP